MQDLFMKFLNATTHFGSVVEASMYQGGNFSHLKAESEDGKYVISITISKKDEEKENV